jgi:hypothetical protein
MLGSNQGKLPLKDPPNDAYRICCCFSEVDSVSLVEGSVVALIVAGVVVLVIFVPAPLVELELPLSLSDKVSDGVWFYKESIKRTSSTCCEPQNIFKHSDI